MGDHRIQVAVFDLEGGKPRLQGFKVFVGMHSDMVCGAAVFSKPCVSYHFDS